MEVIETCQEPVRQFSRNDVAQFVESLVRWHPDGKRWASLPALIRAQPISAFLVSPSTRIVDLLPPGSVASHGS